MGSEPELKSLMVRCSLTCPAWRYSSNTLSFSFFFFFFLWQVCTVLVRKKQRIPFFLDFALMYFWMAFMSLGLVGNTNVWLCIDFFFFFKHSLQLICNALAFSKFPSLHLCSCEVIVLNRLLKYWLKHLIDWYKAVNHTLGRLSTLYSTVYSRLTNSAPAVKWDLVEKLHNI